MSVDFTTIRPADGGEPWEAYCDWCWETVDLDHYGDMEEHTSRHRTENDRKNAEAKEKELMSEYVPLTMGEKIIGAIRIDATTGQFDGHIEAPAMEILRDGIDGAVRSVSLASIFGMTERKDMTVQERWQAYLNDGA